MPTKFVFLILPQVHLLDLAGPDQCIHEAIDFGCEFSIEYCGIDEDLETSAGLGLKKPTHFSKVKLEKGDYLIIAGARMAYLQSTKFKSNKALFIWMNTQYQKEVNLVSICVGAFVLGYAGLLNGRKCTTHFQKIDDLQKTFPKAQVEQNVLFVEDDLIYTSAGIVAGIDLMLHILEKLVGSQITLKVTRELVMYNRRTALSPQQSVFVQYRNHMHQGIHDAQDYIINNLSHRHKQDELANIACMSVRNFTRLFKKETGLTVNEFITTIRKEVIEQLSQNKNLTLGQIARQVGLSSERQLMRIKNDK
jgi:transcriptional regulator GlxA family with amidase domain